MQNGYSLVISLHSNGGYVDYNGPDSRRLAVIVSRNTELPVKVTSYQAAIGGSLGEYVPERYGIPVLTIELTQPKLTLGLVDGMLSAAVAAQPRQ